MASNTVIVFGATGRIGSATACVAQEQGAKVVLGVRDITKPILGLSPENEKEGGFQRVQADLMNSESITEAVQKTGAKRAFIYIVHGNPDGMKSALVALKSAGIEFVVFLSSASIPEDMGTNPSPNLITQEHWQVELNLQEVFGAENYLAVRAGYFATNTLWWSELFAGDELKLPYPEATYDWISPEDVSRVCGSALAKGPRHCCGLLRVYGPDVLSHREVAGTIAKTLGKTITITALENDEQCLRFQMEHAYVPDFIAMAMVNGFESRVAPGESDALYESPLHEEGVANIQRYGGKKATTCEEWVAANKEAFQ